MRLTYVAGPYSASTIERELSNVLKAVELAKKILERGDIPIIPHKITELWNHDYRFKNWSHFDWLNKYCFPLLKKCDAIAFAPGWESSPGAISEWEYAQANGIEILTDFDEW